MAQQIQVVLTCDMCDGSKPGQETARFGLDGISYEIDLCDKHARGLRDGLAAYVGQARRSSAGRRGRRSAASGNRQRTQDIRAWARKKGIKVSERGRISADIIAQYDAARR